MPAESTPTPTSTSKPLTTTLLLTIEPASADPAVGRLNDEIIHLEVIGPATHVAAAGHRATVERLADPDRLYVGRAFPVPLLDYAEAGADGIAHAEVLADNAASLVSGLEVRGWQFTKVDDPAGGPAPPVPGVVSPEAGATEAPGGEPVTTTTAEPHAGGAGVELTEPAHAIEEAKP